MSRAYAPDPLPALPALPSSDSRLGRNVAKWMMGFILAIAVALLLSALTLYQLTSEGVARETLRRATVALTEIDSLIARDYDDLQAVGDEGAADDTVRIEGYPIDVPLGIGDVEGRSAEEIRETVLDRSVDALYASGTGELRAVSEGESDIGLFSVAGLTDNGLGFMRERNHDALRVFVFVFAVGCLLLVGAVFTLARGFGRLTAVGAATLVGALPVLVAGLAMRLFAASAGGDDAEYVRREFLDIAADLSWIAIRNGLAFAAFGAALLVAGWALALAVDRRAGAELYPA